MTKEQALAKLECDTHTFWRTETAQAVCAAFGLTWQPRIYGDKVGAASYDVSGAIAAHVGATPKEKPGFQVRADCAAIRIALERSGP